MLYSGKKNSTWRDKTNKYSNSRVVRKKNYEGNKKLRKVIKIRDNPGTKTWPREQTITTNNTK
jgi:DsbC/DsbD-like thiol-disulfide interchange protein